jgi:hypothetical protein
MKAAIGLADIETKRRSMKRKIMTTGAILGLFVMLNVAAAQAQSANRIQANIPFNFVAGDAKLKAGKYIVERLSMETLTVTSMDGKTRASVLAPKTIENRRVAGRYKLVFQRYGDQYFLSEAWIRGGGEGSGLYPSGAERRLAREIAKTNARPQSVEIVASSK